MQYRRGALLFFEVIHQIWRLHGPKINDFNPSFSKITRPVAAIKSFRFALLMFYQWKHIKVSIIMFPDIIYSLRWGLKKNQSFLFLTHKISLFILPIIIILAQKHIQLAQPNF